ncbi:late competence development ComFB family protein [Bacillus sp. 1P06AnD]|uniref:late competence development ComFB family protein n=1 Tax=Bacillus sp. 1P06AnD TaxID=3132208 RepID=UPI0039A33483
MEMQCVNVMEEIVRALVTVLMRGPEYQTFCHCDKCTNEIIALSLNSLPAYYVTNDEQRKHTFISLNTTDNLKWINKRIIQSIYSVGKYPIHSQ